MFRPVTEYIKLGDALVSEMRTLEGNEWEDYF